DVGDAVAQAGAVVGRVNTLELQVNDPETGLQAVGQKTDGLFAQLDVQAAGDSDWGAGDESVFAGTITIQTVIAQGDYALSQRQDTVEAKVGDTQAMVQQTSQAVVDMDGRISASWTLKLQVAANGQYYAAGMGIGIENQPDGSYQSQILFQADRFAVINLVNGQVTSPFVIQGGQTFISQALIGTGWIQNAMIGDVIQSTAVGVGGQPRWKLDKNASLTMRGVNANGGFMELTDSALRFWNSAGNVALVELGELL
ncbi:MAG: DUF1983 domain-containing protein, partial [Stenotrophomonas sp.]